jgi:flagellar biosynthesis/type III secretory pathway chaperone
MNNHAFFQSLRDHLNAELTCHRSLLALGEQQQRALISHDVAAFANLTKQAEPGISEQQRLRKERERIIKMLALAVLPEVPTPALTQLITVAPEPLQSELKTRHLLLKDALEKLRLTHERNQALLRQGLSLMRDLVNALTGDNAQQGYDRRGHGGGTTGNGRLVNLAG